MFTGIITATEHFEYTKLMKDGLKFKIPIPSGWNDLVIGESIAVNGACLTITKLEAAHWHTYLMPETLSETSFGQKIPKKVNLERALQIGDRLSGHLVQGHVDEIGRVIEIDESDGYRIKIEFSPEHTNLVIEKGSIVIDGVSLTVASCKDNVLSVALIPHTLATTTLSDLQTNDVVNLEFDIIGKYVIKNLKTGNHAES